MGKLSKEDYLSEIRLVCKNLPVTNMLAIMSGPAGGLGDPNVEFTGNLMVSKSTGGLANPPTGRMSPPAYFTETSNMKSNKSSSLWDSIPNEHSPASVATRPIDIADGSGRDAVLPHRFGAKKHSKIGPEIGVVGF